MLLNDIMISTKYIYSQTLKEILQVYHSRDKEFCIFVV